MASLLTSILKKQIGLFVKDWQPERLQDWKIDNVELNCDILQQVLSIPQQLELTSVKCSSIQVNIPWRKLKHVPIVLELDHVDVVLEEPLVISSASQGPKKRSSKFVDRILDGLTFVVKELDVRIKPLSRSTDRSSAMHITSGPVRLEMTDSSYEVVDLQKARNSSSISKNEYMRFRHANVEWASFELERQNMPPVLVLERYPIHAKLKSRYLRSSSLPGGRAMAGTEVVFSSSKPLDIWFDEHRWKYFEDFIHSLMACMSRRGGQEAVSIEKSEVIKQAPTRWKRMKNFIQKRKVRKEEAEEETEDLEAVSILDSEESQEESTDELDELLGAEVVETSEGVTDDLVRNSVSLELQSGTVSFFETFLDSNRAFLKVNMEGIVARFDPYITRRRQALVSLGLPPVPEVSSTQTVSSLFLSVSSITATDPSPHPAKHNSYHILFRSNENNDTTLNLKMVSKRSMVHRSGTRRNFDIQFAPCRLVWDGDTLWRARRVLSPRQEVQTYIGKQMEKVVDAVLDDNVVFKIVVNEPILILPPFAGYHGKGGKKVAAMVLHARAKRLLISSWDLSGSNQKTEGSSQLAQMGPDSFPNKPSDYELQSLSPTHNVEAHKYCMSILDARADILDEHGAPPHRLLDMPEFAVILAMNSPDPNAAQFELSVRMSEIEMFFSRRHSLYLRYAVDWRVQIRTCDSLGVETSYGQHGAVSDIAQSNEVGKSYTSRAEEFEHSLPITFVVLLKADKAVVTLLSREDGIHIPGAMDEAVNKKNTALVVAEGENMEALVCNHLPMTILKARLQTAKVHSPGNTASHFNFLLLPGDGDDAKVAFRYEKKRSKRFGPEYAKMMSVEKNGEDEIRYDCAWAQLRKVKVSVIVQLLVKIIAFVRPADLSPPDDDGKLLSPAASLYVAVMKQKKEKKGKLKEKIVRNLSDMHWDLSLNDCELFMVDSSETPECLPLHTTEMHLSRRGTPVDQVFTISPLHLHPHHEYEHHQDPEGQKTQRRTGDYQSEVVQKLQI